MANHANLDEEHDGLFLWSVRSAEDYGAVLDETHGTCYFYLMELLPGDEQKIIAAIRIQAGPLTFSERDVQIQWSVDENIAGLFIRTRLWAAFDIAERKSHGGDYAEDQSPKLPGIIAQRFLRQ